LTDLAVVNCGQLVTLAGADRPRTGRELRELAILADGAMRVIDGRIDERVYDVLSIDASVRSRTSYGGTAPERVREQIAAAKSDLDSSSRP